MDNLQNTQFFKILAGNQSCHGGVLTWSLPVKQEDGSYLPGDWHEYEGELELCKSGFHVTSEITDWIDKDDYSFYEVEVDFQKIVAREHNKASVQKIRLIKPLDGVYKSPKATIYCKKGKFHRDSGLPAIEFSFGGEEWWEDGKLLLVKYVDGGKSWYKNFLLHREDDLPAKEIADGGKEWWQNGLLHRENDLPARERFDGSKEWWVKGRWIKSSKSS